MDPPLSELGVWQASRLADRLSRRRPVAIYSSDLDRSMATATVSSQRLGLDVIAMPALREVGLGQWEGRSRAEIAQQDPELWSTWLSHPSYDQVPQGEGAAAFAARVGAALDRICAAHPDPDSEVAVFTHGGVVNMALSICLPLPVADHSPFRLENTSVTVIERVGSRLAITLVNDTCHLEPYAN
jgi:broad specificity phosphatase PhoE